MSSTDLAPMFAVCIAVTNQIQFDCICLILSLVLCSSLTKVFFGSSKCVSQNSFHPKSNEDCNKMSM